MKIFKYIIKLNIKIIINKYIMFNLKQLINIKKIKIKLQIINRSKI